MSKQWHIVFVLQFVMYTADFQYWQCIPEHGLYFNSARYTKKNAMEGTKYNAIA